MLVLHVNLGGGGNPSFVPSLWIIVLAPPLGGAPLVRRPPHVATLCTTYSAYPTPFLRYYL